MVEIHESIVILNLDTAAARLVSVTAECEGGKCKSIAFEKVPAFMFHLDLDVDVLSIGRVVCDIIWNGMIFASLQQTMIDPTDPFPNESELEIHGMYKRDSPYQNTSVNEY